jgi:hypothetical protein
MEISPQQYVKTLEDELDWKLFDQLYGVVSQISGFCFEIKKFCVTTIFVVLTLMVKFTNDHLDYSIFLAAVVITVCFWFLDSVAYFYQVKLRGSMNAIRDRILARNPKQIIDLGAIRVIAPGRIERSAFFRVKDAFFNHSMWLYAFLITIELILWALFRTGEIR